MNSEYQKVLSRTERKKEATRQNILNAALKMFKDQGVEAATMEQIAEEADIAKGTLYNYFPVKEAIIDEIMKRSFREKHSDRVDEFQWLPDTRSRMIFIFTILIEGIQDNRELYETYAVYRMKNMASLRQDDSVKSGLHLLETAIIELGQKNGEIRSDYPDYIVRDLFEFAFVEAVKQYYMDPDNYVIDESVEKCADIFVDWATVGTVKKHKR